MNHEVVDRKVSIFRRLFACRWKWFVWIEAIKWNIDDNCILHKYWKLLEAVFWNRTISGSSNVNCTCMTISYVVSVVSRRQSIGWVKSFMTRFYFRNRKVWDFRISHQTMEVNGSTFYDISGIWPLSCNPPSGIKISLCSILKNDPNFLENALQ